MIKSYCKAGTIITENLVFFSYCLNTKKLKVQGSYNLNFQWKMVQKCASPIAIPSQKLHLKQSITWFITTPTRANFSPSLAQLISWSKKAPGWPQLNCGEIHSLERWWKLFICPWIRQSSCRRMTIDHGDHATRNLLAAHFAWTTRAYRQLSYEN